MSENHTDEVIGEVVMAQHRIWAHWMCFQFKQCQPDKDGNLVIPKHIVEYWKSLIELVANGSDMPAGAEISQRKMLFSYLLTPLKKVAALDPEDLEGGDVI